MVRNKNEIEAEIIEFKKYFNDIAEVTYQLGKIRNWLSLKITNLQEELRNNS